MTDLDEALVGGDCRRTWIVPYGFLTRARLMSKVGA